MENYLSEPRPEFTRALLRVRGVAVTARHVRTRRAGDGRARGEKAGRVGTHGQLASAPRWPEFEVITGVLFDNALPLFTAGGA